MNTKTAVYPAVRYVLSFAVGSALIISSFFAFSVPQAHAAALTQAQITAILNLLTAFNVPAATIANVKAILQKSK